MADYISVTRTQNLSLSEPETAANADDLAERLTMRDRDGDDRPLCLECAWLDDTGRCLAAAAGRKPGAVAGLSQSRPSCSAYGLRKGLA
jgi:hypothetical protein